MTHYLIQETVTSQAVAAIMKKPHDRTEAVRPVFESVGGKLEHYYVAINENTVYMIADIPDQPSGNTMEFSGWLWPHGHKGHSTYDRRRSSRYA